MVSTNLFKALAISLLGGLLLSSCGGGSGASASAAPARQRTIEDFKYKEESDVVRGAEGTPEEGQIIGGRRSQFENKRSVFSGNYQGKEYKAGNYNSKAWNGSKDFYGRKEYYSSADGSRFQNASNLDGESSRFSGSESQYAGDGYSTGDYRTSTAREGRASVVRRDVSHYNDDRSRDDPSVSRVLSSREHQQLSVQETNALLGRDR